MTVEFDEQDGATLLRPLAGAQPRGASTVDIARAIADGDRHHRRVRLAGSAGAGATVVLVAVAGWTVVADGSQQARPTNTAAGTSPSVTSSPSTVKSCTVKQLATPAGDGPKAVVTGSDPTGRYILGRTYPGGPPTTVVWEDQQVRKVVMPGDDADLYDATSAGVFVGYSFTTADTTTAWVYKGGKFTKLAGEDAKAFAINEREVIVGSVRGRAATWASPTAQPTMLATPDKGMTGQATGIDEDGTVVGTLGSGSGSGSGAVSGAGSPGTAYVWSPEGSVRKLSQPTVKGKPASAYSARAIRDGWVLGWASYDEPNRGPRWIGAPRWNLRTGAVDTTDGMFYNINAQGRILGQATVIAPDGTNMPLPLPDGYEAKSTTMSDGVISDDGTVIAGYVSSREGPMGYEPIAVVWKCGS